jgi:predicted DNA-binding transcriptional regulator AlpA
MSDELQKLIRAKQAAYRYGVGKSTIWLYCKQGKIKSIKVSKGVTAFSVEELDRFFGVA